MLLERKVAIVYGGAGAIGQPSPESSPPKALRSIWSDAPASLSSA